jgi:3-dehydrosphinganine reductase
MTVLPFRGGASYYLGKYALVVGASEGIGLAIACDLAQRGANVVVTSRDEIKLLEAARMIEASHRRPGRWVEWTPFDVRHHDEVKRALDFLKSRHGAPDFLIICAGGARPGYFENLSLEDHRAMMELNYFGSLHVVHIVAPDMIARRSGTIVLTSSALGLMGLFGFSGYCASKHALVGLAETLRSELRVYGVRVSCFCPPAVQTPGLEREKALTPKEICAAEELGAVLKADDVARALLNALPGNPFLVIPGARMKAIAWMHRIAPAVVRLGARRPAPPAL